MNSHATSTSRRLLFALVVACALCALLAFMLAPQVKASGMCDNPCYDTYEEATSCGTGCGDDDYLRVDRYEVAYNCETNSICSIEHLGYSCPRCRVTGNVPDTWGFAENIVEAPIPAYLAEAITCSPATTVASHVDIDLLV